MKDNRTIEEIKKEYDYLMKIGFWYCVVSFLIGGIFVVILALTYINT